MNLCFTITCFEQVDQTIQNIKRIRSSYKIFNNSLIIVVSTSDNDCIINKFIEIQNEYKCVKFISLKASPGSDLNIIWKHPKNINGYVSWRHQFLPPRILLSIQNAADYAYNQNINYLYHLHSDTYIKSEFEENIVKDIEILKNRYILGDLSTFDELTEVLPRGLQIHPEGLIFNLKKCKDIGYLFNFDKIFDTSFGFQTHNYGSIESLIGQYLHFCLSGKNIISRQDNIDDLYKNAVYFRMMRTYHGEFDSGLVNLPGEQ